MILHFHLSSDGLNFADRFAHYKILTFCLFWFLTQPCHLLLLFSVHHRRHSQQRRHGRHQSHLQNHRIVFFVQSIFRLVSPPFCSNHFPCRKFNLKYSFISKLFRTFPAEFNQLPKSFPSGFILTHLRRQMLHLDFGI